MAELPFVAGPPTERAAVGRLAARAAGHWGLPAPELLRVGMNVLYVAGDVVLRVCRPTADPAAAVWLFDHLRRAGVRGPRLATAEVLRDDDLAVFAVVREIATGAVDWTEVGRMVARVHALDVDEVTAHHPLPRCWTFPWWDFDALLAATADALDVSARRAIEAVVERHRDWWLVERPLVVCHGDVHPGNVIATADGPVLIDWDLLCLGPAAWDHGPMMTMAERWGGPVGEYEAFADGAGGSLRGDDVAEAVAQLRLVAATLMRVRAASADPSASAEAERRLAYWRGDPDAPAWVAQ